MTEYENASEAPQEPASGPEVEPVPEAELGPEGGAQGLSELEAARAETAGIRVALAEAELRAKMAEMTLERERVARRNGLPDELAEFLRGETAEELAVEAAKLAKFAGTGRSSLGTGGLDPSGMDMGSDGIVARIMRKSREV